MIKTGGAEVPPKLMSLTIEEVIEKVRRFEAEFGHPPPTIKVSRAVYEELKRWPQSSEVSSVAKLFGIPVEIMEDTA